MKRISFSAALIALGFMCLLVVCNPAHKEKDSSEIAEEQNDKAFETNAQEKDAQFVVDVVEGSYAEIKMAQIATRKSNDEHIKAMAAQLELDHSAVLKGLKGLANQRGITIPLEEDDKSRQEVDDLDSKNQADFNKEWIAKLEKQHKDVIHDFEVRWKDTEDEDLKTWINSTLPKLREHLNMLSAYQSQVK